MSIVADMIHRDVSKMIKEMWHICESLKGRNQEKGKVFINELEKYLTDRRSVIEFCSGAKDSGTNNIDEVRKFLDTVNLDIVCERISDSKYAIGFPMYCDRLAQLEAKMDFFRKALYYNSPGLRIVIDGT